LDHVELVIEGSVERRRWQLLPQELLKRCQRPVQSCCRDLTVTARQGTILRQTPHIFQAPLYSLLQ
jgi:hypothetical protein